MKEIDLIELDSESKLLQKTVKKLFKITARTIVFFLSGESEKEIHDLLKIREKYLYFTGLLAKNDNYMYGDIVNIELMESEYFNDTIQHAKEFLNKNQ